MKVKDMKTILTTNKFDNCECNFKLKSKGPQAPEWFKEFYTSEFRPLQQAFIDSRIKAPEWFKEFVVNEFRPLVARIDKLETRIDNLVAKNKLRE